MNEELFEQCFSKTLPMLDDNSVIILDNAPYHSRKLEKVPTSYSRKADIQNWLRLKKLEFDETMLKYQILDIVKQRKSQYNKYIVDEIAKTQNKTVLRSPPYHCELNPIELIWAEAKNFVAKHNTTYKLSDVKDLFNCALMNITPEKWQKCIEHVVQKVESRMWRIDNIMETQVEQLIIHVDENNYGSDSFSTSSE
ncbi:uncharacterized protein LOC126740708 [Anthonomus grandis grandis]|uniref:uncharacterized protein LOC126740708 n=1 Tax=Anthonomus grandis grandis TaxID=2921223 RepID=UPI002165C58A|nr:uncharacterized protein LOC126740708 [Anthonomus grandis grandis]